MLCFAFCLGVFVLIPFNSITNNLWSLGLPSKDWAWTTEMGALSPGSQTAWELQTPGVLITENFQEGLHLCTKSGNTQLPMASSAGHFTPTTSKTKTQKQSSATGFPQTLQNIPLHTALPIRGKKGKKKTTHLLPVECKHKSHSTRSQHKQLNQPFPLRAKTKRKKEYDPKALAKETSNGVN